MKSAQEVMSKDIIWSVKDASLTEISKMMVDCDCWEIPILNSPEERKLSGIVTDRDIVCRTLGLGKNPMTLTAGDIMTTTVVTGDFDMSLSDCIDIMEENQIYNLPIIDENGVFCGTLSQDEIMRNLEDDAEGEINSESIVH